MEKTVVPKNYFGNLKRTFVSLGFVYVKEYVEETYSYFSGKGGVALGGVVGMKMLPPHHHYPLMVPELSH